MLGNFENCWAFTRQAEGGFTKNPDDPGNWTSGIAGTGELLGTNFGISAASYPNLDIANLTIQTAGAIYQRDYWIKVAGDSLPLGVDLAVFDAAVNIGVTGAATILQRVVGAFQDGQIGPKTLAAVAAMPVAAVIADFIAERVAFYKALPAFSEFGDGWTNRSQACQVTALAMVSAPDTADA